MCKAVRTQCEWEYYSTDPQESVYGYQVNRNFTVLATLLLHVAARQDKTRRDNFRCVSNWREDFSCRLNENIEINFSSRPVQISKQLARLDENLTFFVSSRVTFQESFGIKYLNSILSIIFSQFFFLDFFFQMFFSTFFLNFLSFPKPPLKWNKKEKW